MALFGKKTEDKKPEDAKGAEVKEVAKKPSVNLARPTDRNLDAVLIQPHITEKAVGLSEKNVYTFEVNPRSTKFDVRDAIKQVYGVTPVKVNIVKKAPRTTMSRARGRKMTVKGQKKAYVYLKDGDTISMV